MEHTGIDSATPYLSNTGFAPYLPVAKIGGGNYIYVYSWGCCGGTGGTQNAKNYFGISVPIDRDTGGGFVSSAGLTVSQAYNMDNKVDDGLPVSGRVTVNYSNSGLGIATGATPDNATTCYNNTTKTYSTNVNNGSNVNCALSFQMQGAGR